MKGLHILAELHGCAADTAPLREVAALRAVCLDACRAAGLSIVAEAFHGFVDAGAPGRWCWPNRTSPCIPGPNSTR
jgi:S-adenosylmethionine decarboxylase